MHRLAIALVVAGSLIGRPANAYLVAGAVDLDKLAAEADVIVKVVARTSQVVKDPWFEKLLGFEARETELEVVSVLKGAVSGPRIRFRHYAPAAMADGMGSYSPQHYTFEAGKPYLLLAKRDGARYRQLWKAHRSKEDQGLWRAADARPVARALLREVLWTELTRLLAHTEEADAIYALQQLDELSGVAPSSLKDFPRSRVIGAVVGLLSNPNDAVVDRALVALGAPNPYLDDRQAPFWLASMGPGLPGIGPSDHQGPTGASAHVAEVLTIATDHPRPLVRAHAIRALGYAHHAALLPKVVAWTKDGNEEIRAAATLLLADFPGAETDAMLRALATDRGALVRKSVALAIGYGRRSALTSVLGSLVLDPVTDVKSAAAMTLLSFPVAQVRTVLTAQVSHPLYRSLFVNALAKEDATPYLAALMQIVRHDLKPETGWWGGQIPWGMSWNLLYQHARHQPSEAWTNGKLEEVLGALESPITGPPAPTFYSSAEPRDLYALYVLRGQTERAKKFREACRAAATYDMQVYFEQVDKAPKQFERDDHSGY